jgi:hypothetical protein
MSEKFKLKRGVNICTNSEYHGDKTWLSSSQLKLLLDSKEEFYKQVFEGQGKKMEGPHLDEGSYTHSLILEPHTIPDEYALWDGWRKQGAEWKEFKKLHEGSGKILLSKPQAKRCESFFKAYMDNPAAVELVDKGEAEHSICAELMEVQVKKRSDWINIEDGYIADVKTSAHPVDIDSFKQTISKYKYDLSASLYCMIAEEFYGKPFDFYFICISKSELDCQVFKVSRESMDRGKLAVIKALKSYKKCMDTGIWVDDKKGLKKEKKGCDYEILEV